MTDKMISNKSLDALFEAERAATPVAPDDLFARIALDAQHETLSKAKIKPVEQTQGKIARWLSSFGGWQSVSALTACAVLGLYLGYATDAPSLLGIESAMLEDENLVLENSFADEVFFDTSLLEG